MPNFTFTPIPATLISRREQSLNPLLDALEAALAPAPATGIQHLGLPDMIQHAYIAGRVETDQGVLGDQAIAIVPVEILCL